MIRFLHAADLHLDSPLRGLERYEGAPVERIRMASRRALENLVKLAIEQKVAFVLLAGDIYDGDWHDVGTGLFFVGEMAKLKAAGIKVFLIAGNHDAANKMSRRLPYPDNVVVFGHERPTTHKISDLGVAIHGQSYAEQAESSNLAISYPAEVKGWFNIGMLHTAMTGREGHEPYAPCLLEDLLSRNYDYWALGHIHQRESVHETRSPRIEFPGNLQGRNIRETGAKGCLLVDVGGAKIVTKFWPLDVVRWQRVRVSCEDADDRADVFRRVESELEDAVAEADGRLLAARVELFGSCALHEELLAESHTLRDDVRAVARSVGHDAVWIEKVQVHTTGLKDGQTLDEIGDDALSEFSEVTHDLAANPDKLLELLELDDVKALAAKVPAELKEGEGAILLNDPMWARTLLDRARAILISEAHGKEADE